MTRTDLTEIKKAGYVRTAFNSLGITAPEPKLTPTGIVVADCSGIDKGDSRTVADRLEAAMRGDGWDVRASYGSFMNMIMIQGEGKGETK